MFHGVRHAGHVVGVAEAAHVHVHGSADFVRVRIMDEQGLQLVRQADDAVGAVVEGWALHVLGQALREGLATVDGLGHCGGIRAAGGEGGGSAGVRAEGGIVAAVDCLEHVRP